MIEIHLVTRDGRHVATERDAVVAMMVANGKAPEVLVWGERVFVIEAPDAYRGKPHLRYREGLAWPLRTGEPLEIPLHSVDGTPAGKTVLPVSTGEPIGGLAPLESGNPPTAKTTESYIPGEFETAAAFLAWAGTDARRWSADFMRRFSGLMMSGLDDGAMIGWFASAIEAGRSAGYAEGIAYIAPASAAVNEILEGTPESWDEDAAGEHIAVRYVRELERRLDTAGISRERYPEEDAARWLGRLVFEALGEASMCWNPTPPGVFDSDRARRVGDELVAKLGSRQAIDSMIGEGGVPMKLAMGETDPIVTCGCGNRSHGDSINDAVTNWTAHVTQGGCPLKERL